jgi:hypothetical protein
VGRSEGSDGSGSDGLDTSVDRTTPFVALYRDMKYVIFNFLEDVEVINHGLL